MQRDNGGPDTGHESSGNRIWNESHQVGEFELPDHETAHAGEQRADNERTGCSNEQRVPLRIRRGCDRGHDDHQRWRQSCNCAAITADQCYEQAGCEVAEQDQANTLGRVRRQGTREDETSESHLGDEKPEAGRNSSRQRGNCLSGQNVPAKLGLKIAKFGRHTDNPLWSLQVKQPRLEDGKSSGVGEVDIVIFPIQVVRT